MSETGQQSTLDELRKTFKYDSAKAQYEQQGYYGSGGKAQSSGTGYGDTTGSSVNYNDLYNKIYSNLSSSLGTATAALSNLSSSLGTAYANKSTTLQGELGTITNQYDQLLSQITAQGTANEATQAKTTNAELAKRGITSDSTAAQNELAAALGTIKQTTNANLLSANSARSSAINTIAEAIANIPIEQTSAQGSISSAIASLLANASSSASSGATSLYSQLLSSEKTPSEQLYQELQNKLLQKQLDASGATNYLTIGEGQAVYDPTTGQIVYKNPKTSTSSSVDTWE